MHTVKKWEILGELKKSKTQKIQVKDIVDVLLKNRGIRTKRAKEEFFKPTLPKKISVKSLSLSTKEISKVVKRIKKAKKEKEKVVVFGDYDADGVCATAILWECLYALGLNVSPYIPERFSEGYGLKAESLEKIKIQNPNVKLIITVDNGIVANEAVDAANELGVDVIVTDHHQKGRELPKAYAIIHTDKIGGAGAAWILAREISKKFKVQSSKFKVKDSSELAAIGTIADQLPLIGANRSFTKYGLEQLNKTERIGLLALFEEAAIKPGNLGTYEVNYIIAPRINAMGRLEHAIDSLRLLCTKNEPRARELALQLGKTNVERQKVVDNVVAHARQVAEKRTWQGVVVVHHESYHEGVIGLAASKLVEEFYRPAIVFSKGEVHSKASARSIPGFNIIEALRSLDDMLLDGGGHPMAAGFTLETKRIGEFSKKLDRVSAPLLTDDLLTRRQKIDVELKFNQLNWKLLGLLKKFEPTGIGNPTPTFVTRRVDVLDARVVGRDTRHLKLTLEKGGKVLGAIAFGFSHYYARLSPKTPIDVVYRLEENVWNNHTSLQLKIKDIKLTG